MGLAKLRIQKQSLVLLKKQGYNIPQLFIDLVDKEIKKAEGVMAVYECKRCKETLEVFTKIKEALCKKGHKMSIKWIV